MTELLCGDSLEVLKTLPSDSVDCCITSPPYYALRDYGEKGQIGLEDSPMEYIDKLVAVFHEVKRVLKPEGTLWLNIADSYCGTGNKGGTPTRRTRTDETGNPSLAIIEWGGYKGERLNRYSVDARLRPPRRRVVLTARHYMVETQPDARKRNGSLHEIARIYFSAFQVATLLF